MAPTGASVNGAFPAGGGDMAALCTLLLAFIAPQTCGTAGTWESRASLNQARQEAASAVLNGLAYTVGGLVPGPPRATDTVECYDPSLDTWTTVAPMPSVGHHQAAAALGGLLYVVGGAAADTQPVASVFVYDPVADLWGTAAPLPEPRYSGAMVAWSGRLWFFGGEGPGGAVATTYCYDPLANAWSEMAPMPTAREHVLAAVVRDEIFVIGGRAGGVSTNANERYRPATDTWTVRAPLPTTRSAMGVAAFGRSIHVLGGETPMLFDDHEVYDTRFDTWRCLPAMPLPRHGLPAVALPEGLLFPGGGTAQGWGPTATTDLFVPAGPPESQWTTLPPVGVIVVGPVTLPALLSPAARTWPRRPGP